VYDAVTATKGRTNRGKVTDVTLNGVERTTLPFENPGRFVGVSYECPDLMAGVQ
jgi:hypothetical protein